MVFPTLVSVGWFGLGLVVAGCGELFCLGMGLSAIRVSCVNPPLIVPLGCWLGFLFAAGFCWYDMCVEGRIFLVVRLNEFGLQVVVHVLCICGGFVL